MAPTEGPPPVRRYVVRPVVRRCRALPVAQAPDDPLARLVGASGAPVWPLAGPADHEALEALAGVFGATTQLVGGAPLARSADRSGLVVGIGACEAETALYAHLTERRWQMAATVADLPDPLPDVVVLHRATLDPDLVQRLLREPVRSQAVGVLWGRTADELRRRVLVSAAARVLDGPLARRRTDVSLSYAGGVLEAGAAELLGAGASAAELRRAVTQGAGVLTLAVHGDGVSMSLSPQLALCALAEPSPQDDPRRTPACVATGRCSTLRMDAGEALARHVVAPREVAARVLAMPTCYGAFVGSLACDASWGLLPRLLASPRVGAVLAPAEPSVLPAGLVGHLLSAPLERGMRVGAALAAYERHPMTARLGHRMLLFGDPDTRAAPLRPGAVGAPAVPADAPALRRVVPQGERGEVGVLHLIAASVRGGGDGARTSEAALAALAAYRQAPDPHHGAAMRMALLEHVRTMKGRPYGPWLAVAALMRRAEEGPCPGCAWPVRPFDAEVRGVVRRLLTCPRCGVVADWPAAAELEVRVTPPDVELSVRGLPPGDWDAALYVVPANAAGTQAHPWPRTASGAPSAALRLPRSAWPAGPLEVRAVLLAGTTLLGAGVRTRADGAEAARGAGRAGAA